jgi:tyrosine-protein kinase Etk/Wzc
MSKHKKNFIDLLFLGIMDRKLIIKNFLIVCTITAIISLIIPKWFRSTAVILPPVTEEGGFNISSLLSKMPIGTMGLGMGSISADSYQIMAIMQSRTLMESVARKFDLQTQYDKENMEETVKELLTHISSEINENGTITLSSEASTKFFSFGQRDNHARIQAKEMTEYILFLLDSLNQGFRSERARNTRIFIEKRYNQNKVDLANAENALKQFQETYGTIAVPEQMTATISAAAELNSQIIMKEIELSVLRNSVSISNSKARNIEKELGALKTQYHKLIGDRDDSSFDNSKTDKDVFIPLSELPDKAQKYVRLFREVKLQELLLEFIIPQYEQAKIQEAKDTPTIQILDSPVLPILRARPKRALLVILMGFLSIAITFLYILLKNSIKSIPESSTEHQKINLALGELKSDLNSILKVIKR